MKKEERRTPIRNFEDLDMWQNSQDLAVFIYKLTKNFPKEEQFGLTNQIRRASAPISANIAEGFGRRTNKDKLQFYTISYGSLLETKNFLYLAEKLGYASKSVIADLFEKILIIQKQLNVYMRKLKNV